MAFSNIIGLPCPERRVHQVAVICPFIYMCLVRLIVSAVYRQYLGDRTANTYNSLIEGYFA